MAGWAGGVDDGSGVAAIAWAHGELTADQRCKTKEVESRSQRAKPDREHRERPSVNQALFPGRHVKLASVVVDRNGLFRRRDAGGSIDRPLVVEKERPTDRRGEGEKGH